MKRVKVSLISKDLNLLQKRRRVKVVKEMLTNVPEDPIYFNRITTDDKTWFYEFDVETVQQFSGFKKPESKNTKFSESEDHFS